MKKFTFISTALILMLGVFAVLPVKAQQNCEPVNQSASNITTHGAELSWDGLTGDTWVRYRRTGDQGNYHFRFADTSNTVSLNNLISNADYTWEINTFCEGVWTGYSWPQSFVTLEDTLACIPLNQQANEITGHSAFLTWENLTGLCEVRYFPTGTTDYLIRNAHHNNNVHLINLLDETEYTWEIRTYCDGQWTEFGWAETFITLTDTVVCEPINQLSNEITAHTAILSWEGLTSPTWVRYFETGSPNPVYRFRFAGTTNTVSLIYLQDSTDYTWEINTFCNGAWTGYSWAQNFVTYMDTVICDPTNQLSQNVTGNSVDLSWEGLTGPTWVRYKIIGDDYHHYHYQFADSANTVSLFNLHENSTYGWELNTLCNGFWTGYSWEATFTTTEDTTTFSCEPSNQLAGDISDHSVTLTWEGLDNFTWVKYQRVGSEYPHYKYAGLENTVTLHQLIDSATYIWELNTWCDSIWTGYGWESSFSTLTDTIAPSQSFNNGGENSTKQITIENNLSDLHLYPNPVADELNITYTNESTGSYHIRIVNVLGSVVFDAQGVSVEGENIIELNISDLKNGMYSVILETGNAVNQLKVIKN